MGFRDLFKSGRQNQEKASRATTPPMQPQKPKYGDKKIVKAKNPKKSK